ncbi:MAG: hypothetical protein EA402_11405 [Planctomycetota bacterium]|nr:MAG: hypothetical protein EA402_11405 [Planctomycetota bacterium]
MDYRLPALPLTISILVGIALWGLSNIRLGAEEDDPGIFHYPPLGAEITTVQEGESFVAAIPIRNPNNRAGRIVRTDSTCVCNVLKTEHTFLLPGQETILHFDVANERTSGKASQIVWLYFSDPEFDPLEVRIRWNVEPTVTVDVLPPNQREMTRPEDPLWRDIGRLESIERPEDGRNLVKNLLLSTTPKQTPEGGLEVKEVLYEGSIWTFTIRRLNDQQSLVLLRAADPEAVLPQGVFEETFTIRTNHPRKPEIVMELGTKIDPEAGRQVDNPLLNPPPCAEPGHGQGNVAIAAHAAINANDHPRWMIDHARRSSLTLSPRDRLPTLPR